jgi:UDP-N-acetylmuramyl tripeptide synthase
MKKISITGTKGKTTVTNILAEVLPVLEKKVLHVNTNGAYLNGKSVITKKQSQAIWDIVPTVSPGRFLYHIGD